MKNILLILLTFIITASAVSAENYEWAKESVDFCVKRGILSGMEDGSLALGDNLTREQMAKLLCDSFGIDPGIYRDPVFEDVKDTAWSYGYINAIAPYMFAGEKVSKFDPKEKVSREEFCATMILAYGLKTSNLRNRGLLDKNFKDANLITKDYKNLIAVAVERGLMSGDAGYIYPDDLLTRAQACSLLYRAICVKEGTLKITPSDLGVIQSSTKMTGEPEVTMEEAIEWAKKNNASEMFIEACEYYWYYGELTSIRPEILYAQSAKETGYGRFGGNVLPEQNNFAGIKKYGKNGDATEDHEDFASIEDGVRGHFNHMCAYLGLEPIGEPHGRYKSVKSMPWAGNVKTLEELGGKWCPDLYYGFSVLHDYLELMK